MSQTGVVVTPEFIGSHDSAIFAVQYFPDGVLPAVHIIYIAPFGEEMNRSRALVAKQARLFAQQGYSCTVFDFFGTGDSQGELRHATLDLWLQNIQTVLSHLKAKADVPVVFWGVRFGGLLALEFVNQSVIETPRLVLWQPIISGKKYVTQMLRLRIASQASKGLNTETTDQIRDRLSQGEEIDVAGYPFNATLINQIEERDIKNFSSLTGATIDWFEFSVDNQPVSRAISNAINTINQQGNQTRLHEFASPPVWLLQKRHDSPELLEKTLGLNF